MSEKTKPQLREQPGLQEVGVCTPSNLVVMGKRAKAKQASKTSWFRISLELLKAALGGAVRAVISHWLGHP